MMRRRCLSARSVISVLILVVALSLQAKSLRSLEVKAAGGISLRPPFDGAYRLTTFFDHNYPNYGHDNEVTIYTGESVADCSPHCYHGHPGIDWSMATGTPVVAAANGIVRARTQSAIGYGWRIVIEHSNGYHTLYTHLSGFNVTLNQMVSAGDVIGWSGDTGASSGPHLHFGVYRGPCARADGSIYEDNATDPFGWRGSYPDPLLNRPTPGLRHTATCLWRSRDEDPISCADTVVEDAGAGSVAFPAANWPVSNRGNGYHTFYHSNTTAEYDYHTWVTAAISNPLRPGPGKVYAFIPEVYHSSQQVTYGIWTTSGWQQATVDQSAYANQWALLGTFMLADHGEAGMWAYTGESAGTRWVAADALKWRQYSVYVPLAMRNYCSPRYGQLIVNGNFDTGDNTGWTTSRTNGPDPIVQPYGGTDYGA